MSGHFLLNDISKAERDAALALGATWSPLSRHDKIIWDAASRNVLYRALSHRNIPGEHPPHNRNGLPPHKYLHFSRANTNQNQQNRIRRYFKDREGSWIDHNRILRPCGEGLGLRDLCTRALNAWAQNKLGEALEEQFLHGTVTIEIYHVGGKEMQEGT